nr:MAG TPA: helix-turn-helix domain protein [Caudoviricetes sp.]
MTKKDSQEQKLPPDVRGMNKTVRAMYNSSAMGFVYNDLIRSYHGLKKYSKQADKSVYRSTKQIQEQLDWMDIRDIRRYVKKLVDDGWIKVTKRAHGCMYILPGNKLPDYTSVASKISLEVLSKMAENDPKNGGSAPENNTHNGEKSGVSHPSQDSKNGGSAPENSPIIKCNNNQVNLCRDSEESLQRASQRKQACTTPPLAGAQQAACLVQPPAELSSPQSARASLGQDSRKSPRLIPDAHRGALRHLPPQVPPAPPQNRAKEKKVTPGLPASHPDVKLLVPLLKQVHAKITPNDPRKAWTKNANVMLGHMRRSEAAYAFQTPQEAALYLQMVLTFPWASYAALTGFPFKLDSLRGIIDWKSAKMLRAMNLFLNRPVDSAPREIKMLEKNKYLQMVCPQYDIPWPSEAKASVRKDGVHYFRGMKIDNEMGLLLNKANDIMYEEYEKRSKENE